MTDSFDVCMGAHVICKFTNTSQECIVTETTIGDLQALGGVENEPAGFATAAVPLRSGDAADSIFLASFIPLSEGSRWPGDLDHYIQPLPVKENESGQLVADTSVTCADGEDTGCLAWRAGPELLEQAPTAAEVTTDRRIGRRRRASRHLYHDIGSGVPRTIRAFDWTDSDALANEYDLWDGFDIPYVAGDTTSEAPHARWRATPSTRRFRSHEQTSSTPTCRPAAWTSTSWRATSSTAIR